MAIAHKNTLASRLIALAAASSSLTQALQAARSLGLASWCIGAGAVRNLVWDHLHGLQVPTPADDIDLVFFDDSDLSPALEQRLQARLAATAPHFNWEVVNQASVHLWAPAVAGRAARPFQSLSAGIASWPEIATCVGVTLTASGEIDVIAPHGLNDLFDMVVRWNPDHVPKAVYTERMARKRFAQRWPRVNVLA